MCSPNEIHDYFYNTYQLQFYDDPSEYRQELKQTLFALGYDRPSKENIPTAIQIFKDNHKDKNFCDRKLYQ